MTGEKGAGYTRDEPEGGDRSCERTSKRAGSVSDGCFAVAYASGSLIGCGQVRLIRDAPDGGVVAIPNNSNQWPSYYRNRAEYLMKRKFPEGYVIVKEEEGVDNPATRDGRKPNEHFEYEGGYIRLTTYDRTEYRITFRSAAAAKNAPANAGSAPRTPAKDESKDELPAPRRVPNPGGPS